MNLQFRTWVGWGTSMQAAANEAQQQAAEYLWGCEAPVVEHMHTTADISGDELVATFTVSMVIRAASFPDDTEVIAS